MNIENKAFTVSELSNLIKYNLESSFDIVCIIGEIADVSRPKSGHIYFSLKDDGAIISAVCWKNDAKKMPKIENGMSIMCSGYITSYVMRSTYQVSIISIREYGSGKLLEEVRQRKIRLEKEGLFSNDREINRLPETIAIITSLKGAALQDMLSYAKRRYPCHLLLFDSIMQGNGAIKSVCASIEKINNKFPETDTIIIARGGGSSDDLNSFNSEQIVKSVYGSQIPIISAIGHETDYTLCDFAADSRASTPTAAIEIATTDLLKIKDRAANAFKIICYIVEQEISYYRSKSYKLKTELLLTVLSNTDIHIIRPSNSQIIKQILDIKSRNKELIKEKLIIINDIAKIEISSTHLINNIKTQILNRLSEIISKQEIANFDITGFIKIKIDKIENQIKNRMEVLFALKKENVLARGFAIVIDRNSGKFLSNIDDLRKSKDVDICLQDGIYKC